MNKVAEEANRRQRECRATTCAHFTGIRDTCCKREVNYTEHAGGDALGWMNRLPCFASGTAIDVVPCDLYKAMGMEAVEAEDVERGERTARMLVARAAITEVTDGKWGVEGSMSCPCCAGKLAYSVSGLNGHVWAQCSTEGCVWWME